MSGFRPALVRVTARADMFVNARNESLPAWIRVGCVARARTDEHGHARFATSQLARTLRLSTKQTSEAIAIARSRGWVDQASTARCVVLPGCGLNPCDERHA